MEVKIGVQHAPREVVVDVAEEADAVDELVTKAVDEDGVVRLSDNKGRRVLVPAARLAYVEIGSGNPGAVGFRS